MCFVQCKKKKKLTQQEKKERQIRKSKALAEIASKIINQGMGRYL